MALLLALPLALLGAILHANEHKAMGLSGLDCDGLGVIFLFALPALAIYALGLVINARRWRRPLNLAAAIVCLLVCGALALNVADALRESRATAAECAALA